MRKFYPISPRLLKRNYGIIVFLICVPFLQVILTLILLIWLKKMGKRRRFNKDILTYHNCYCIGNSIDNHNKCVDSTTDI